jgi:hypothetical protein
MQASRGPSSASLQTHCRAIIILKLFGLENDWRLVGRVFTKECGKGNAWAWYREEQVMSDARPDTKFLCVLLHARPPGTVSDGGVSIF